MDLNLSPSDMALIHLLLKKELEETRVEIHHARNMEFKAELQIREHQVAVLLGQFRTQAERSPEMPHT